MGLMTLINLPVILILSKYAFRTLIDYRKQKKMGLKPLFKSKDIGIKENLDYWN